MHYPTCRSCGIVIRWQPTIVEDKTYCCIGCAQGGPCVCDYDNLPRADEVNALVLRTVHSFWLQKREEKQLDRG
jgi:hypothetical protein